jgi:hypothetical protein
MIADTSAPSPKAHSLLGVSGDIVVDHHIYEGERTAPTMDDKRGVEEVREHGGACAIHRLLAVLLAGEQWDVALGVTMPPLDAEPFGHHSYATWKPFDNGHGLGPVWLANLVMGYGHGAERHKPEAVTFPRVPRVLVLDDAGLVFRHETARACWPLPADDESAPDWIVLKMSSPVAQGDLWQELAGRFLDRVVCVVSAAQLRRESVGIRKGLSWESTVEDLRDGLRSDPTLNALTQCRHLVVTFSTDGALWLNRTDSLNPRATLVCDMGGAEGEGSRRAEGTAFGYHSCIVAAIARALALHRDGNHGTTTAGPALAPAIAAGLAAMRDLARSGHGAVGKTPPTGFPATRLAGVIADPGGAFSEVPIAWPSTSDAPTDKRTTWMIVESSQRPLNATSRPSLTGLARQVVLQGTDVLRRFPHATFGDLFTADRLEIEALRSITLSMVEYGRTHQTKRPMSIGVFGPPGAGKSFGVKQIARSVFGKNAWLEFNLAQFTDQADLIVALHQVRDFVIGGVTPVVFWDEFDSHEYKWLQYLLSPMQDGRFQEGLASYAIGKCVFVFAGGTSPTFAEFGPRASDGGAQRRFELLKGPDFHGRLDLHLNVLGPNQRTLAPTDESAPHRRAPDPDDVCYPLRRAILIRALLQCPPDARLDIDPDLLDALIQVSTYKHGARSVEKLVASFHPARAGEIRQSLLPVKQQLAMLVDATSFADILGRNTVFKHAEVIEALAPAIHETWRSLSKKEGWKMQPHLDQPFEKLAPVDKEENRAAARRIPEILGLAGLGLVKAVSASPSEPSRNKEIRDHLEHHLERLAEAEHDGWMTHRLRNGWRFHETRDDVQKLHNALLPYEKLTENDKKKDRNSVRHFPDMVQLAGYQLVFFGEGV